MSSELRRDFGSRDEMLAYLRQIFPEANQISSNISDVTGGRASGEKLLNEIQPKAYAQNRNYLDGDVTHLSPYIRHGVLTLSEVRDAAIEIVESTDDAVKFITELGFRDYFQHVYISIGDGIWESQEEWKTGYDEPSYSSDFPSDIRDGQTGLLCVDSWQKELIETGYLHNHIRMYFASYIVHWRHIHWQVGALWFLQHLIDGDPASNNLSWQWVASTFSHKPYYFNRENLERFTKGIYCQHCPLYGKCDFEGSYVEIAQRLFPNTDIADEQYENMRQRDEKRLGKG